VAIDPSDSGEGDAAGIVAASIGPDGVVAVIGARAAVNLAVDVGASEIAVESFQAGATYTRVVSEVMARVKLPHPIRVSAWPPKGSGRGGGDSLARSTALLQALEVGTCRVAGHLPDFETAAVGWQAGQHQPDALAALVVAFDVLTFAASRRCEVIAPPMLSARLGRPAAPGSGAVVVPFDSILRERLGRAGGGWARPAKTASDGL
jgi:hypothetical protein